MMEATTAREISKYYETYDQEVENLSNLIRSYCEVGRYSCITRVRQKHLEQLLKTFNTFGYKVVTLGGAPRRNIGDEPMENIQIIWAKEEK